MTKHSTIDWKTGRDLFESGHSLREIAESIGVSFSGVRRRAAKEGWKKGAQPRVHFNPRPLSRLHPLILEAATESPLELVRKGRGLISALMDELEKETRQAPDLHDLADASDDVKARAVERAVSLPTRVQAAKNLAQALVALTAQVGKKAEAELAAAAAGRDSEWGNDLDNSVDRKKPN